MLIKKYPTLLPEDADLERQRPWRARGSLDRQTLYVCVSDASSFYCCHYYYKIRQARRVGSLENTVCDTSCSLAIGICIPFFPCSLAVDEALTRFPQTRPAPRPTMLCVCSSNAAFPSHQNIQTHEHVREAMYDILLPDINILMLISYWRCLESEKLNNHR